MEKTLKQRIIEKGVTVDQVAKMIGVDRSTLSRILNGKQPVSPKTAERIDIYLSRLNTDDKNIFDDHEK